VVPRKTPATRAPPALSSAIAFYPYEDRSGERGLSPSDHSVRWRGKEVAPTGAATSIRLGGSTPWSLPLEPKLTAHEKAGAAAEAVGRRVSRRANTTSHRKLRVR